MPVGDRVILITILSGLGAVISAMVSLPQMVRLIRTGDVAGVSPSTSAFTVVAGLCWGIFGACTGLPLLAVSSALSASAQVPILVLLRRAGVWPARNQAFAALLALAYATIAVVAGWAALTAVLVVHSVIQYGPQVRLAVIGRDLSGVAPASPALLVATSAVWGMVGMVSGDAALVAWAAVVMVAGGTVLARLLGLHPMLPASGVW